MMGVYGIITGAIFTVLHAYGTELTFPLQPALVSIGLMVIGNTGGTIFTVGLTFLLEVDKKSAESDDHMIEMQNARVFWAFILLTGLAIINLILTMFIKEDLS